MLTASLRLRLQFRCDDVIRCSDKDRQKIAEIMFETYNVQALCMKPQPLLAMYSYGATTGVVVDIGERLDIFPLDSGYMFENLAVNRFPIVDVLYGRNCAHARVRGREREK